MTTSTSPPGAGTPPMTILLAEDDEDLRSLLAMVLRRDGHRVVEIGDGPRLRAELAMRWGQGDRRLERLLVIADVRLPALSGLQVLSAWESRPVPPFIVMTAFPDDQVRAQARALGALAVFDKPFDFDDLRGVVRTAGRSRSRE